MHRAIYHWRVDEDGCEMLWGWIRTKLPRPQEDFHVVWSSPLWGHSPGQKARSVSWLWSTDITVHRRHKVMVYEWLWGVPYRPNLVEISTHSQAESLWYVLPYAHDAHVFHVCCRWYTNSCLISCNPSFHNLAPPFTSLRSFPFSLKYFHDNLGLFPCAGLLTHGRTGWFLTRLWEFVIYHPNSIFHRSNACRFRHMVAQGFEVLLAMMLVLLGKLIFSTGQRVQCQHGPTSYGSYGQATPWIPREWSPISTCHSLCYILVVSPVSPVSRKPWNGSISRFLRPCRGTTISWRVCSRFSGIILVPHSWSCLRHCNGSHREFRWEPPVERIGMSVRTVVRGQGGAP